MRRLLLIAVLACLLTPVSVAGGATLPPGFQEEVVFSGLANPMVVRFSPDGRVFVAEKSGLVKVFDSLSDPTPSTYADLRTKVHNYWDRGLLGMALDPQFPADPYIYVLYTHDAAIGGTAPRWGTAGATSDPCPNPPGGNVDGCVVSGRLSRVSSTGVETVLVTDWCQQYPSHSQGQIQFGPDGLSLRVVRRRRRVRLHRLGPGRQPAQPVRRPAGRGRRRPHAADGRGRQPARAGPAHERRPGQPRRLDHPGQPRQRGRAAHEPALLQLRT